MIGRRFIRVWASIPRVRLRLAGLICNEHLFGLARTGSVTGERVLRLLAHLSGGLCELFCHPAAAADGATPPGFRPAEGPRRLTSLLVSRRLVEHEIRLVGFGDLAGPRP